MNLENMTDVCKGKIKLEEIQTEIARYMYHYSPSRLVIDVKKEGDVGYITTIYIPTKEFKRGFIV